MLRSKKHLHLFTLATIVWVAFWVIGLPLYFQQYSTLFMLIFDGIVFVGIVAVLFRVLRPVRNNRRMTVGLWIAFYFTVPLAVYDWLYCGVFLGHGWAFVWDYWYLTVYYLIPWLVVPGVVAFLSRRSDLQRETCADPQKKS